MDGLHKSGSLNMDFASADAEDASDSVSSQSRLNWGLNGESGDSTESDLSVAGFSTGVEMYTGALSCQKERE